MQKSSIIAICLLLTGCASRDPEAIDGRARTSSDAGRTNLTSAMESPLRDVNLVRTKIPLVLLAATEKPYAKPRPQSCAVLAAMIRELDVALGEDLDAPVTEDSVSLMDRGSTAAIGYLAGAASDLIPFRGWVRKLTGAERHDKLVVAAIEAGAVRRAYLKGIGETRNCRPPAAPYRAILPPAPVARGQ
jgi:hypothetical protein